MHAHYTHTLVCTHKEAHTCMHVCTHKHTIFLCLLSLVTEPARGCACAVGIKDVFTRTKGHWTSLSFHGKLSYSSQHCCSVKEWDVEAAHCIPPACSSLYLYHRGHQVFTRAKRFPFPTPSAVLITKINSDIILGYSLELCAFYFFSIRADVVWRSSRLIQLCISCPGTMPTHSRHSWHSGEINKDGD